MKNKLFTSAFFLLVSFQSFACSCGGPTTFCDYISRPDLWNPDLIVKGVKIGDVDHGFDFEINEVYKGIEIKKIIRIWGDVGHLCRFYNGRFRDGDEYYIALFQLMDGEPRYSMRTPFGTLEKVGDYVTSFCGQTYWHWTERIRTGEPEEEIEACLAELSNIPTTSVTEVIEEFCGVEVSEPYPNPTRSRVKIDLPEAENLTEGTARIFDDCGKLVRQFDRLYEFYASKFCLFQMYGLEPGVYFLDTYLPELCESSFTKRIVVY